MKRKWLKYGVFTAICVVLVVFYCASRDFSQLTRAEKYRTLCDAFTIPGLISLGLGALIWASGDGIFCGLQYSLRMAFRGLLPGAYPQERYYDYLTRTREKKRSGYGFLLLGGGVCMGIALVLLALFYCIY